MKTFAIIGGSGLIKTDFLEGSVVEKVSTPWGEPSAEITRGQYNGMNIVFLPRHGRTVKKPPHMINYRANVWALAEYEPTAIVAICSVGGVVREDTPGTIAVPDQLVDYTYGRETTYNTGETSEVNFIDFTSPFDSDVREKLLDAAEELAIKIIDGGTYGATQGPRLETAAEIARLMHDGVHYVGMTAMPEAALARELNIPYAAICPVVNPAAGIGKSRNRIDMDQTAQVLGQTNASCIEIILNAFSSMNTLPDTEQV